MSDIRVEDGTIRFEGKWMSARDLADEIQKKMDSGDMKISAQAKALEELTRAMEKARTIEAKLVLSQKDYEALKKAASGAADDSQRLYQAVVYFISKGQPDSAAAKEGMQTPDTPKKMSIKCPRCKNPIEVTSDERPIELECPSCGTGGKLTAANKWSRLAGSTREGL